MESEFCSSLPSCLAERRKRWGIASFVFQEDCGVAEGFGVEVEDVWYKIDGCGKLEVWVGGYFKMRCVFQINDYCGGVEVGMTVRHARSGLD